MSVAEVQSASYQWQSSSDGNVWADIAGANLFNFAIVKSHKRHERSAVPLRNNGKRRANTV